MIPAHPGKKKKKKNSDKLKRGREEEERMKGLVEGRIDGVKTQRLERAHKEEREENICLFM